MNIGCFGGFREVGRNAVLLDSDEKILCDFGINVEDATPPIIPKKVDHCLLAHTHLDHVGSMPVITRFKCPIYATAATFEQSYMLLKDSVKIARIKGHKLPYEESEIAKMKRRERWINYGDVIKTKNAKIEVYSAGHIPGSVIFVIEMEGKRILYTSDFNTRDSRLVKGANIKDFKNIDIVITESTYASREHPNRSETEKKLWEIVSDTISNEGTALIPAFAVGRSAEILLTIDSFRPKFPVYLDGMARQATEIALAHPETVRDSKALTRAMNNVRIIRNQNERKEALSQPCAIITTGGCIDGGPAAHYIRHLWSDEKNTMIFVGYQIPKTAGRYLLDTGRYVTDDADLKLKMKIEQLDFSGHVDRNDLFNFVNKLNPKKVICMHGDNCQRFAKELQGRGFDAIAPKMGDIVKV